MQLLHKGHKEGTKYHKEKISFVYLCVFFVYFVVWIYA